MHAVPAGDPRSSADVVDALGRAAEGEPPKGQHVLALGNAFGPPELLEARLAVAATGVQLPGGGQVLWPGRRLVALYGHPGTPSLGSLGEQPMDETLQRARDGQGPTLVEAYTYRMGAHTTTDDPTRYRMSDDLEHWKLKDPIARLEVYMRRNGLVDDQYFADLKAEADELGHHLREGCKALPDPQPMSVFDHVYTEMTDELAAQRDGYRAYLDSFEGAGH